MITEKDKLYLSHISDAIGRIEDSLNSVNKEQFISDYDMQDSTLRRFEVIGEAANNLSAKLKDNNNAINWRKIIDMRNRVIHGYFDVDLNLVWIAVTDDIPVLKEQVEKILKSDKS